MTKKRTIIISNRLPVRVEIQGANITYHNSEGGLATGLSSISNQADSLWIGWPGIATDDANLHERITQDLASQRLVPVMLCEKEIDEFYEGFSNETLWPLFHYFPTYANYNAAHWETYVAVNKKFADAIVALATEQDTIWIHDYHLMLVPQMVREQLPEASIGFFQHIPFPNYEVFRLVPWREELLEGLLGADLIGFHTDEDVRHFTESVEKMSRENQEVVLKINGFLTVNGRNVTIDAFPMGIDYEKFYNMADSKLTHRSSAKLAEMIGNKKLIISIDRLDYSKGIVHRLKAYQQFLEQYPDFHEQVVFFQLIVPSRDSVKQYAALKEEVNKLVSDINSRYGTIFWQPICYFYRSMPMEMLSALYATADIAMVTPLRDGMNLVSKEFIASKVNTPGVLILSEMAGAAKQLSEAILVNPNDQQQVVNAIHKSLIMPVREQIKRMKAMQRVIAESNVFRWVDNFMGKLKECKLLRNPFNKVLFKLDNGLQQEELRNACETSFENYNEHTNVVAS
jgi:trehalose 6-phosphate synthase/phosphatase